MKKTDYLKNSYEDRLKRKMSLLKWQNLHLDPPLFFSLLALALCGLFILYSASNQNTHMMSNQVIRLVIAFLTMYVFAQIPPRYYQQLAPWVFVIGLLLLLAVLLVGHTDQGAKRWLNLGLFRFQPSEIMKIALPMMLASYFSEKSLPPNLKMLMICAVFLIIPVALVAKQPDLGTALIVAAAGLFVLLLAGINWKIVISAIAAIIAGTPVLWHFMHTYQKERVLTFLNPERDPLGSGYHIIQSKIAIGSGGILGKGWLNGTQSHLQFLPAHATDFIFAVSGEELGFIGCLILIILLWFILARCLYISAQAQTTFSRLLAGSLSLTFFLSFFVNIGMVIGIIPVVGVPLPLVSYGGTSLVTLMASFGIIMSIQTHRKLLTS